MSSVKAITPRDRILETAEELFYRQGFQATGINQLIEESGVAKATFYAHFPSKDDLCVAYLQSVARKELELVRNTIKKRRTAIGRYMAPIEVLEPWLKETEFRGCPFLNIASEVADEKSAIRKVGVEFYQDQRRLVADALKELKESDSKRYGHLKPDRIADEYMTIFTGAVGLCEIFHSIEPVRKGIEMARGLVEVKAV